MAAIDLLKKKFIPLLPPHICMQNMLAHDLDRNTFLRYLFYGAWISIKCGQAPWSLTPLLVLRRAPFWLYIKLDICLLHRVM